MTKSKFAAVATTALSLMAGVGHAEQVTVFGPWLGADQEMVETVLKVFAESSGHDVRYVGSDSFEQQIVVDAEAGSAPNVAVFLSRGSPRTWPPRAS